MGCKQVDLGKKLKIPILESLCGIEVGNNIYRQAIGNSIWGRSNIRISSSFSSLNWYHYHLLHFILSNNVILSVASS